MRRPTIADLAREAIVSLATAGRVLNGRLKVREETARRVQEAVQRIGRAGASTTSEPLLNPPPAFSSWPKSPKRQKHAREAHRRYT
jgi:LacI family transcriptional regulator